jgi:glycosyltransferase involved in cell wall biosynthesis
MIPSVSVIVPVYNVQQHLRQCLDSLLHQTMTDIEIICVNDASPDNSAFILEEYALKDSRIKIVLHDKNLGLGPARNTGVACSSGEFISFIDSDDYVEPTFIETLFNLIVSNEAQMSWCGYNTISDIGENLQTLNIPEKVWTLKEVIENESLYPGILPVWNKMFKRELFIDIKQLAIVSEDQPALGQYFSLCHKIVTTSDNLYNYRQNSNSLSKPLNFTSSLWNDFFYSHGLFITYLEPECPGMILRKQSILRHFSILWRLKKFNILLKDDWTEHQSAILSHLKEDRMGLKKYSPVMYYYLLALFKYRFNNKYKKIFIDIAFNLSHSIWLKRTSWLLLPFDIISRLNPLFVNKIKKLLDIIEISFFKCLTQVIRVFYRKPIWLLGERTDTAQDNGIYMYEYLRKFHSEIKTYYIINKSSSQYNFIKSKDHVVQINSIKHKILFLMCQVYASSHNNYCFPKTVFDMRYRKRDSTKNVFLQHGITFNDNSAIYGKTNSSINLFICGAIPEFEFIKKNFGYSPDQVKLTGFARFDGLHSKSVKKQILLMPTWRKKIWENRLTNNSDYFLKSKYYKTFQSLINNEALHLLLQNNHYKLIFYPHYEIQPYLSSFSSTSDRIIIAPKDNYNVQELLISSSILVTDSSSVSFDFAYMYKPLVYYFFDKDDFTKYHLKPGYFNHESMGFGDVIYKEKDLISVIEELLKDGCLMNPKYVERVNLFFNYHDIRNCERIFKAVKSLLK